jgi:bacterioferritin
MNTCEIIDRLNWFYTLEINQVELYNQQSKQMNDIYLRKTLERVVEIEQKHVDSIKDKLKALGGTPTALGEFIAPFTGKAAGYVMGNASLIMLLKANIKLEEKAIKDYKDFLLRIGSDSDLENLLWGNLIDEELHTAWFANKVSELERHEKT